MLEVGLWVGTETGGFIIKKDAQGHPDLVSLSDGVSVWDREDKKREAKRFYAEITGRPYPHDHAAMRQVLWDFLEVAIKHLP